MIRDGQCCGTSCAVCWGCKESGRLSYVDLTKAYSCSLGFLTCLPDAMRWRGIDVAEWLPSTQKYLGMLATCKESNCCKTLNLFWKWYYSQLSNPTMSAGDATVMIRTVKVGCRFVLICAETSATFITLYGSRTDDAHSRHAANQRIHRSNQKLTSGTK